MTDLKVLLPALLVLITFYLSLIVFPTSILHASAARVNLVASYDFVPVQRDLEGEYCSVDGGPL
jgi:hypothetical protein